MTSNKKLAFALPSIGQEEIEAVTRVLESGWITTGPLVKQFESDLASYLKAKDVVAVSSCTAALHASLVALDIGPGDEVITTPLTFAATVNVIVHTGAKPVLADIDQKSGCINPESIESKITSKTKAIIPVHYAGVPCDMNAIRAIAGKHDINLIEDAAHAMGSRINGVPIGSESLAVCFSFYPIKNMTTGEGGAIATNNMKFAEKLRQIALHGMSKDAWKRYENKGSWEYDVSFPGFKYNMTDIQAAIGICQLKKLDRFNLKRKDLVETYTKRLSQYSWIKLLDIPEGSQTSYHLFPIQLTKNAPFTRQQLIDKLGSVGISTSVHFIPTPTHSYYAKTCGWNLADFPNCQEFCANLLSLPLFSAMTESDVNWVCDVIESFQS